MFLDTVRRKIILAVQFGEKDRFAHSNQTNQFLEQFKDSSILTTDDH